MLESEKEKHILWSKALHKVTDQIIIIENAPPEMLFSLDSCYDRLATKRKDLTTRIMEIMVADNDCQPPEAGTSFLQPLHI